MLSPVFTLFPVHACRKKHVDGAHASSPTAASSTPTMGANNHSSSDQFDALGTGGSAQMVPSANSMGGAHLKHASAASYSGPRHSTGDGAAIPPATKPGAHSLIHLPGMAAGGHVAGGSTSSAATAPGATRSRSSNLAAAIAGASVSGSFAKHAAGPHADGGASAGAMVAYEEGGARAAGGFGGVQEFSPASQPSNLLTPLLVPFRMMKPLVPTRAAAVGGVRL